jgi:hypothetical protein
MKIRLVEAELSHSEGRMDGQMDRQTERQADTTKLTVAITQFFERSQKRFTLWNEVFDKFPNVAACAHQIFSSI